MYLHLGHSTVITTKDLIGIFDMDVTTVMKSSRDYLSRAEKNGDVVNVSYELPKSKKEILAYSDEEWDNI